MIAPILIHSFVLGVQHSFEPDHVAAVSVLSFEKNSKAKIRRLMWKSSQWALGHSITLILLSIGALLLKSVLPSDISSWAEWIIGPMMIWMGIRTLLVQTKRKKEGPSVAGSSEKKNSLFSYSLGVGMLHGMAGTGGACTLALSLAANDRITALWIIILQSVAILLSMGVYGYLLSVSFAQFEKRSTSIFNYLVYAVGVFSISIGLWVLAGQLGAGL